MFGTMTRFAALMMVGLAGIAVASEPPEAAVQFDLQWLSPPQVTPAGGQAAAQQTSEYTRLQGVANVGGSFAWPLRYAVEVQRYPILTLRYRARDLAVGPTYANRIMDVQLVDSGGRMNALTVINLEDLVQDGVVHEIRKDLSQVPADAFIDQMRFNFQGGTSGGRLDIYSIALDRGSNSPEPLRFEQKQVEFVVKDAAGNAVPDAEVHLGLLERSNWVALGSTDDVGRIRLMTLAQVRPDGTIESVEAVVERPGSLPQYVAPIKLPAGAPIEVKLSPVAQGQPQAAQAQTMGPSEQVISGTTDYNNGTTYVPYPVYTYSYIDAYPMYWWVPVQYVRPRPIDWCDRDDRWRDHHGDRIDVRRFDHPRPVTPPATHGPPPVKIVPPEQMHHGPGQLRPDDGRQNANPWPNVDHGRDGGPDVHAPGPVVAPPVRLTPPDLRNRGDKGPPVIADEPVRRVAPPTKVSAPPSGAQEGQKRDNVRRDNSDERMTPPSRVESGPTRDSAVQRPAPIVIRIPENPVRSDAPKAAPAPTPEPVRIPEQRDPPVRVQRSDQSKADQPVRRVDPPAQTVQVDPPAKVQREDNIRKEAQRDDAAQRAAAEAQRAESRRDAMQRETAQREQTARRDDPRRVAEAPPAAPAPPPAPTVKGNDAGRRAGAQNDDSVTDPNSGTSAPGRSSSRR